MRHGPSLTIEELETRLAGWLEKPEGERARLDDVHAALQGEELLREPPEPEPEAAQRSIAELCTILDGFLGATRTSADTAAAGSTRAGYAITSEPGRTSARVEPAFAHALAVHAGQPQPPADLDRRFPDLWLVDLALWRALGKADARHLAALWLRSPGRRLLRDIGSLEPSTTNVSPAEHLDACKRAAGLDGMPLESLALAAWLERERPPRWRELHMAVPGLLMRYWQPHDGQVVTALRRLERLDRGSSCTMRGAALGWLLGRAARESYYEVDGIRRDLRDDLPVRLAAALAPEPNSERSAGAALQAVLLRHAARIAAPDAGDDSARAAVVAAWGLAHWMYKCLVRSPYYGADEERLWAELHAHLRPATHAPDADPLDPSRLGPLVPANPGELLDMDELAVLAGVLAHYHGPGPHLDPVPLPVIHFLRRVAIRPLRPGEARAEEAFSPPASGKTPEALGIPGNALGWPAPHLAPPWAARRFLTERRISWLAHVVDPSIVDECLAQLGRQPSTYAWLGFAFHGEGHTLDADSRARVAESWRALVSRFHAGDTHVLSMPVHALAAMAVGALPELAAEEHELALELAARASAEWRPFLFDAHAEAAARSIEAASQARDNQDEPYATWRRALDLLLDAAEDSKLTARERLQSAFLVLRRTASAPAPDTQPILGRLARISTMSPFREHAPLQREVRRLGLAAVSSRP
jgi:hypothetical protein